MLYHSSETESLAAWQSVRDAFGEAGFADRARVDALRQDPDRLASLVGALVRYTDAAGLIIDTKREEDAATRRRRWDSQQDDNGFYPLSIVEEMRQSALAEFNTGEPATRNAWTFTGLALGLDIKGQKNLSLINLTQGQAEAYGEKLLYEYLRSRRCIRDQYYLQLCSREVRLHLKGRSDRAVAERLGSTSTRSVSQLRVRMRRTLHDNPGGIPSLREDFMGYLTSGQQVALARSMPDSFVVPVVSNRLDVAQSIREDARRVS